MRVLFLDFDGVLNSSKYMQELSAEGRSWGDKSNQLDRRAVALLNKIIEKSGCKVVISSTWRMGRSLPTLREILETAGFKGEVIGKTTEGPGQTASGLLTTSYHRGFQIQMWLNEAKKLGRYDVEEFVILDDDSDMEHLTDRFVKTSFSMGLQEEHVMQALKLLGVENEEEAQVPAVGPEVCGED